MAINIKNIKDDLDNNEVMLIHKIAKGSRLCFDRRVSHLGLTRTQWRVLNILRRKPGISQAKLSEIIEVEPMSLSRLLDRMEKNGWIKRLPDANDRRANKIMLTEKVQPITNELTKHSIKLREEFLKYLTEKEYKNFLDTLHKIKSSISGILEIKED